MVNLLSPGRHLRFGSAVDDHGPGRTQPQSRPHRVHCRVPTPEHGDGPPRDVVDRGVRFLPVGLHEVHTGEELVGRVDADEVLTGDAGKTR